MWSARSRFGGLEGEERQRGKRQGGKREYKRNVEYKFENLGIEAVGSTPDEAGKFLNEEIVKWAKVISAANVKAE